MRLMAFVGALLLGLALVVISRRAQPEWVTCDPEWYESDEEGDALEPDPYLAGLAG